jgi:hypothetical protein
MAIMMKRQLNDAEKDEILQKFGKICYATVIKSLMEKKFILII